MTGHSVPQQVQTLPHPNVHLIIERGRSGIFGIAPGRFTRTLVGRGGVFGVKFRPGGFRPFLGRSVATLANRSLSIDSVFSGAADIEAEVLAHEEPEGMVGVISVATLAANPVGKTQASAGISSAFWLERRATACVYLKTVAAMTTRADQPSPENISGSWPHSDR